LTIKFTQSTSAASGRVLGFSIFSLWLNTDHQPPIAELIL
jgi:hypothetical protein